MGLGLGICVHELGGDRRRVQKNVVDRKARRMALGVPKPVIRQARKYLQLLEDSSLARGNQEDLFSSKREEEPEPAIDPLREELQKVNPDELSPREALELLYRLKRL